MKALKFMKKIPWIILAVQWILIVYAAHFFNVEEETLHKGRVDDFNTGWTLIREDGSEQAIELPYYEDCAANTVIKVKNIIPEEYWGKTITLLTADKNVRVYIDGEVIYEFGHNDERDFGKTPGSKTNFIDIPRELEKGEIVIEYISPYDNYGACVDSMTIADRDIAILKKFNNNLFEIGCSLIMALSCIVFCVLAWSHRYVKQKTEGTEYLAIYAFISFAYYAIETKIMNLYYGNHTVHSVIVFLVLMSMSMFLILYFIKRYGLERNKVMHALLIVSAINACAQIPLQIFNIMDFMEMAFVSHAIMFISIFVMIYILFKIVRKDKHAVHKLELIGMVMLGLCGIADIVRSYTLKLEHIAKISRYGATLFCMLMLIAHIIRMVRKYVAAIEENSKLLEQKVELAEKKNEAKTIFLARMSHEIRTPINAVLGMNKMILSESNEDKIKEYAEDVENAAQSLLGIINEVLDLSKIEAGKMTLVEGEYDTVDLLYGVSNMIALRAQTKDLEFRVEVDEQVPTVLKGDDAKLRQVLTNLLSNAVKYTEKGSIVLGIECEKAEVGKNVRLKFSVKDTGIGIKEEDLPKLYEAFERFDEDKNHTIEGTGLGMSITVQFLKLMGSTLEVESVYGEGITFNFTLTQAIIDESPIGDFKAEFKRRRRKVEPKKEVILTEHKVLVVDDNNINRKVFASLMKNMGVRVVQAASGEDCLKKVTMEKYDMVFLDHMMPGMDGVETLKAFKKLEGNLNADTPVIALTANAIVGAKEYYLNEGFSGYMSKPIDTEQLDKILKKYLA